MSRLYQSIYLAIVASMLALALVAAIAFRFGGPPPPPGGGIGGGPAAEIAPWLGSLAIPDASRPLEDQQRAIDALARGSTLPITLFDASGKPVVWSGPPVMERSQRSGLQPGGGGDPSFGSTYHLFLPDGRSLALRLPAAQVNPLFRVILSIVLGILVVGLCAYPLVRHLTRRLERLQTGVATLASGDLSARVPVEGKDEIARLALSFNSAAERIEALVASHRLLLGDVSHELRTPLARARLGLELLSTTGDPKYRAALDADLRELDAMIEEALLASRIEGQRALQTKEVLDLLAIAAEEVARYEEATISGQSALVTGDERYLLRLIRNLLENARRHGKPPIEALVRVEGHNAILEVSDAGPGIAPSERERIFEPFYQVKGDKTGAGLGLSLVRRIAALHNGTVGVAEVPGGTCMRVTLPLAKAPQ